MKLYYDFSPEYINECSYQTFCDVKRDYDRSLKALQYVSAGYKNGRPAYRKKTKEELDKMCLDDRETLAALKEVAPVFKARAKYWSDMKNEIKENFSDENLKVWVARFAPSEPAAVVSNRWNTYMGRIGSTSATITVGKGRAKPFSCYDAPSWDPIGVAVWYEHLPSWMGGSVKCEKIIRSWNDVQDALSEYENQIIYLYKTPKFA